MSDSVAQLGYLGFEVSDLEAWVLLCERVLGFEVARNEGGFSCRYDSYAQRLFFSEGPADDLIAVGWEVASPEELDGLVARLAEQGVETRAGSEVEARARRVTRLVSLRDPTGNPLELFVGPEQSQTPFVSRYSAGGFVAEEQGLGHVVVNTRDNREHERFYCDVLGLNVTDHIEFEAGKHHIDLTFLHANQRHHSVAFGGPLKKSIHHFGIQLADFDDLGRLVDRAARRGVKIATPMGRHPNDKMVTVYLESPSGFEIEIGWGGVTITEGWEPTTYDRLSLWGHWSGQA